MAANPSPPSQRVGVDARGLEPGFKAHFGRGTGRYGTELIKNLLALSEDPPSEDPASRAIEIVPLRGADLGAHGIQKRLLSCLPCGKQTVETQLFLPRRLAGLHCDLVHFLAHGDATARATVPYIVSVLDLIPLRFPELYAAKNADWRFHLARKLELDAIRGARGIIAISEATKRDVVQILGVPAERIAVTPLATSDRFQPRPFNSATWKAAGRAVRERYALPVDAPLLLYVGGIDPRKNTRFLVDLIARLRARAAAGAQPPVLAMVGSYERDDQLPRLQQQIRDNGVEAGVRLLGYVSDEDLVLLYHAADLAVFPSLYEGFGFPVLEALACGVPVVAGNNSSIPEVASDAGILVEDNDTDAWEAAVWGVLAGHAGAEQQVQRGIARAREFSWRRTAELTLQAYSAFLGSSVRSVDGPSVARA